MFLPLSNTFADRENVVCLEDAIENSGLTGENDLPGSIGFQKKTKKKTVPLIKSLTNALTIC